MIPPDTDQKMEDKKLHLLLVENIQQWYIHFEK